MRSSTVFRHRSSAIGSWASSEPNGSSARGIAYMRAAVKVDAGGSGERDRRRAAACGVVDHGMVMIAHRARQQDIDLAAQGGRDQTVEKGVVGRGIGGGAGTGAGRS